MTIRLYQEDPIFDTFSRFDPATGRLAVIDEAEFLRLGREEGATTFTGETSPLRTRFPRRIYFQITRNCNLRCPYCFLKSGAGQPHCPASAILPLIRFLGAAGLMEVRLTGGEPTTHPDFFTILDAFRANDVYVSVATNGMIPRKTLDALAERKNLWVICSVDGARATHNRYRPGTFDPIMANLRYLKHKSPETRLRLTAVLTRENMNQVAELGAIARNLDAESVTIIPLRPQVRRPEVMRDMVTAGEFKRVLDEMVRVSQTLGVKMTTTLATDYTGKIHEDPLVRKRAACAAGREATNLDYDAQKGVFIVYGCSYSPAVDLEAPPEIRRPFLAGEFAPSRPEAFTEIWRDDAAWAIYREAAFKSRECLGCGYYARHQCVGSCPIQNVDYSAITASRDVLAQLRDQLTRTGEWYCYKRVLSD